MYILVSEQKGYVLPCSKVQFQFISQTGTLKLPACHCTLAGDTG